MNHEAFAARLAREVGEQGSRTQGPIHLRARQEDPGDLVRTVERSLNQGDRNVILDQGNPHLELASLGDQRVMSKKEFGGLIQRARQDLRHSTSVHLRAGDASSLTLKRTPVRAAVEEILREPHLKGDLFNGVPTGWPQELVAAINKTEGPLPKLVTDAMATPNFKPLDEADLERLSPGTVVWLLSTTDNDLKVGSFQRLMKPGDKDAPEGFNFQLAELQAGYSFLNINPHENKFVHGIRKELFFCEVGESERVWSWTPLSVQ